MMYRGSMWPRQQAGVTGDAGLAALLPALLFAFAASPATAAAQRSLSVDGVAAVEAWSTDSGSVLLTRSHGRPGVVGRLHLWGAAELGPRLVAYAAGYIEGGNARHEEGTEWYTDLAGVRFTAADALVLDAGRIVHPLGTFASRRYPDRNPLVGAPDAYPAQYPLGVQLSGVRGAVDYRAAIVSLPVADERYLPEPSSAARPAVGIGFTPAVGVRVGLAGTWGPYLNHELAPSQLAGRTWRDYQQRIGVVDARVSRGYLELHGEMAFAQYDVPSTGDGRRHTVDGFAWYGEARYTLSPRIFIATRLERNDYAYIQPRDDGTWRAAPTNMYNGELGAGYRFGARTLLKASARADRWKVDPALRPMLPDGVAFAVQLSRRFHAFSASNGGG